MKIKSVLNNPTTNKYIKDSVFFAMFKKGELSREEIKRYGRGVYRLKDKASKRYNYGNNDLESIVINSIYNDNKVIVDLFMKEVKEFIDENYVFEYVVNFDGLDINKFYQFGRDDKFNSKKKELNVLDQVKSIFKECRDCMFNYAIHQDDRNVTKDKYYKFRMFCNTYDEIKQIFKKDSEYRKNLDRLNDMSTIMLNKFIEISNNKHDEFCEKRIQNLKDLFFYEYPRLYEFFDTENVFNYSFNGVLNDFQVMLSLINLKVNENLLDYEDESKGVDIETIGSFSKSYKKFCEAGGLYLFSDEIGSLFVEVKYDFGKIHVFTQQILGRFPLRADNKYYVFDEEDVSEFICSIVF